MLHVKNKAVNISKVLLLTVPLLSTVQADKKVGAGAMFITQGTDGEDYVLLGERATGSGWVNFGGKVDPGEGIAEAASREIFEESMGEIDISPDDLLNSVYTDLVKTPTLNPGGGHRPSKQNYRMYTKEIDYFAEEVLYDRIKELSKNHANRHLVEMNNFGWFKLKDIMKNFLRAGPAPEKLTVQDIHGKTSEIKLFQPLADMLSQQKAIDLYGEMLGEETVDKTPVDPELHTQFTGNAYTFTQTEAHLKALLGDNYVDGDVEKNIDIFLKDYHDPFYANVKQKEEQRIVRYEKRLAGLKKSSSRYNRYSDRLLKAKESYKKNDIDNQANNDRLRTILVTALKAEQENKDKVVLYHSTETHINFLWDVVTEFRQELLKTQNPDAKMLRAFDTFFKDVHSIDDFARKMDEQELHNPYRSQDSKKQMKYNYLPGYTEGGLSTNLSLFGNHGYKGSSSFAYLLRAHSERPAPSLKLLKNFFNMLGLDDEEMGPETMNRLQEYTNIFLKHFSSLEKMALMRNHANNVEFLKSDDYAHVIESSNGVMLQFFMDPETANKMAHITEVVGDRLDLEIDPHQRPTSRPTVAIGAMRSDPMAFEQTLRKNHDIFQNQSLYGHGEFAKDPDFVHTNVLESRMVLLPELMAEKVHTNTYFLKDFDREGYRAEIRALVARDAEAVKKLNPTVNGLFSGVDYLDEQNTQTQVTSLMIQAMLDTRNMDRLEDLNLLDTSFTARFYGTEGMVERVVKPLEYALEMQNYDLALLLIHKGASLSAEYDFSAFLDFVMEKDDLGTFEKITQVNPALLSISAKKDKKMSSLLHKAIDKGALKIVRKLLSHQEGGFASKMDLKHALKKVAGVGSSHKDYLILSELHKKKDENFFTKHFKKYKKIISDKISSKNTKFYFINKMFGIKK